MLSSEHQSPAVVHGPGRLPTYDRKPGSFSGVRLVQGELLQATLPALRLKLAEMLMASPPYELRWLSGHTHAVRCAAAGAWLCSQVMKVPACRQLLNCVHALRHCACHLQPH
jgi:hypothetical protein